MPVSVISLIGESRDTMRWMRSHRIRFIPMFGRQSFKIEGRLPAGSNLSLVRQERAPRARAFGHGRQLRVRRHDAELLLSGEGCFAISVLAGIELALEARDPFGRSL